MLDRERLERVQSCRKVNVAGSVTQPPYPFIIRRHLRQMHIQHPILLRVPHVAERGARVILRVPSARLCITFSLCARRCFLLYWPNRTRQRCNLYTLRARDVTMFLSSHYARGRSNVRDIMPAVAERCLYRTTRAILNFFSPYLRSEPVASLLLIFFFFFYRPAHDASRYIAVRRVAQH